jgi:hypothetical protein
MATKFTLNHLFYHPCSGRGATVSISAPIRRAFFYPRPIVIQPGSDQVFIALDCLRQRHLGTPVQFTQETVEIVRMIRHAKLALDKLLRPLQRPTLGRKTRRSRAAFQVSLQDLLLLVCQLRSTAWRTSPTQLAQSASGQAGRPVTDRRATHPQMASDLRLRELAGLQQMATGQPALFHLFAGKG